MHKTEDEKRNEIHNRMNEIKKKNNSFHTSLTFLASRLKA
jgi:hypothetical protein